MCVPRKLKMNPAIVFTGYDALRLCMSHESDLLLC